MTAPKLTREIRYFGCPVTLACDGVCGKAWGINNRPKVELSDDPDDYAFLADNELGDAPAEPGTWEGCDTKPRNATSGGDLNRWCTRECERSVMVDSGKAVVLPDFTARRYNIPRKSQP